MRWRLEAASSQAISQANKSGHAPMRRRVFKKLGEAATSISWQTATAIVNLVGLRARSTCNAWLCSYA
eukprot:2625087-Pleurochrysis_carterae.AAC.3